jgi:hypothetical protein
MHIKYLNFNYGDIVDGKADWPHGRGLLPDGNILFHTGIRKTAVVKAARP